MPHLVRALAVLVLLGACGNAGSADASDTGQPGFEQTDREAERRRFLAAERALAAGDRTRFAALLETLENYPLYPYLVHAELESRLASARDEEVERFLERWGDTPFGARLRSRWLEQLAREERWEAFLRADRGGGGARLGCLRAQALLASGREQAAFAAIERLWLVGRSQPPECDGPFAAWQAAGRLTAELVWARIGLAMQASQLGLARYLARFLDDRDRALATFWREIHQDANALDRLPSSLAAHPRLDEVIYHGLARLAWRSPALAAERLAPVAGRYGLSANRVAELEGLIGLSLALEHDARAYRWLERVPDRLASPSMRTWRVLIALRHGQWSRALAAIERLDPEARSDAQWRYWRARALERLGETERARAIYTVLAERRSYYGFLAADRLGRPYTLAHEPLAVSEEALDALARRPGLARARELDRLGRRLDARREWHHATVDLCAQSLASAGALAARWGWPTEAIAALGRSGRLDDVKLRFPIAYADEVRAAAEAEGLDPALVLAVARRESAFMSDARSPRGALGLMQLLPSTAREMAAARGMPLASEHELLRPATNLRLGAAYLRDLLTRLDGHPALAAAAYNAGPRRVREWRPEGTPLPADIWIDTVPFVETRRYLRAVLAYTIVYEMRLGRQPGRLATRLRAIGPG